MSAYADLISFDAAVTEPGSPTILSLDTIAAASDPDPDGITSTDTIDGTVGQMATAPAAALQRLGVALEVDDERVAQGNILSISFEDGLDADLSSWSVEVALEDPDGPFGNPLEHAAPGTCQKDVTLSGVYETTTGAHLVPFVSNGVAHNARRSSRNGFTEKLTGVSAGGRFSRKLIDLVLPPGHCLPRRRVIEIAARRAGVQSINLVPPSESAEEPPMMKPIQFADANFLPQSQELADVDRRKLAWDRLGALVWRPIGAPD